MLIGETDRQPTEQDRGNLIVSRQAATFLLR